MSHIDKNTMTMTENCFDLTGHTIPYTKKAVQPGTLSHRHDGAIPPTPWVATEQSKVSKQPVVPEFAHDMVLHPEIASNASSESWSDTKQNAKTKSLCMQATRYEHHACDVITDTMSSHRAWFPWSPQSQNYLGHMNTLTLPINIYQMNHGQKPAIIQAHLIHASNKI